MPTAKQKKAADLIVENHGNVSKSMREAGYTDASAKNPKNLTESKGFQELCEELGLTDNLIVSALIEDIKANKNKRVPELQLAAKMKGLLVDKVEHSGGVDPVKVLLDKYGVTEGTTDDGKADGPVQGSSPSSS